MPIINISTSASVSDASFRAVRASVVGSAAEILAKPAGNFMFSVHPNVHMSLGLEGESAVAFVEFIRIGDLTQSQKQALTLKIFESLASVLGIPGECIYLNFIDVSRSDWSWKSKVLGNG